MFTSPRLLLALPALSLCAGTPFAAAEPGLDFHALTGTSLVGIDPALVPPGQISRLTIFDPLHALIRTQAGEVFLSDGVALRRVMVPGTQIPGQQPGVTWGGAFRNEIWPLEAGGSYFSATASGPGIGSTTNVLFSGTIEAPTLLGLGVVEGSTRNGLRLRQQPEGYQVGLLAGPFQTIIPTGYVPPGFAGRFSLSGHLPPRLNSRGELSFVGVLYAPDNRFFPVAAVANSQGSRVIFNGLLPLQTDRGPVSFWNHFLFTSHAMPDGSVAISEYWTRSNGLWLIPPNGPDGIATTIAHAGDRAPSTREGVTFQDLRFLTANRTGGILYLATLTGPGVNDDNLLAVYLWRDGHSLLIARSREGTAVGAGGPRELQIASMNDQDDVGILFNNSVSLYKRGSGTVSIAAIGTPLPAESGTRGAVEWTNLPFLGIFSYNASPFSGGDDDHYSLLSPDGWFSFSATTTFGTYYGSVRVTSPGCIADFNNDGFIDFFDYNAFVDCFEGGECSDGRSGDSNDDGFIDFFDYSEFVSAFELGC